LTQMVVGRLFLGFIPKVKKRYFALPPRTERSLNAVGIIYGKSRRLIYAVQEGLRSSAPMTCCGMVFVHTKVPTITPTTFQ